MQITFGDDAFDSFVSIANEIPRGYIVALLADGEEPSATSEIDHGTDVVFLYATDRGVRYQMLDAAGDGYGDPATRSWEHVSRIHVY